MSEKGLNNVIRELRVAISHLNMSEVYSETQVNDHNVSSAIHDVNLEVQETIRSLNEDYRKIHYRR